MKETLKRKNYYLDEKKIGRAKAILGAKTETEAIDAALNLVVFRKQILTSLEKSRRRFVPSSNAWPESGIDRREAWVLALEARSWR